jgi:AraC-like DNA-binding protein/mannose-6-phosphate isomerase-like protein (cupin superfamily)
MSSAKSPLFQGIDYIHHIPDLPRSFVQRCSWAGALADEKSVRFEFPLLLRRERYDRSNEVLHHHNDFYALYVVRGGRGNRVVNGRSHSMARGDVFLMAEDTAHYFHTPIDLTLDAIYFQKQLWTPREWEALRELPDLAAYLAPGSQAFDARGRTDHFGHLSPELHARVEGVFVEMKAGLESGELCQHLAARAQFFALLVKFAKWRMTKTFNTRPARGAGIAEVLSFCDENFHRALNNEQLAEIMHFSKGHFRAVFTREVGMSPGAYIKHLRLQQAQKLLAEGHLSVADIARLSGFSDSSQMSRAFKKSFGASPLEFRARLKISA